MPQAAYPSWPGQAVKLPHQRTSAYGGFDLGAQQICRVGQEPLQNPGVVLALG